ncbi:hypothetical protein SLS58_008709 [Diplodia intermedia]|uniref:H-type lectin domain-containing protein n=1 Tax=Diplodia intermedia TaxID=856260 RepID=A0ABR3TGV6_9PEZI
MLQTIKANSQSSPTWGDWLTMSGLSGGAAVLAYTQSAERNDKLFDFQPFYEADVNYFISVRAVTSRKPDASTTFHANPPLHDGFSGRGKFGDSFISGFLDGEALWGNMLLDAYMEFRDIHRVLSTHVAGIKAGTMDFKQREDTSPKGDMFDPTPGGLAKAKSECTIQMMKIIEAVETLGMPPTQSKKEDFPEATFKSVTDFRDRLPAKMQLAAASMTMAVDQPEQSFFPAGVWDTIHIHDWRNAMQRTEEVIKYDNGPSGHPLPSILTGLKKMDAFGGANLRFDSNTESVTTSSFAVGLEQWSDSLVYE